MALSVLLRFKDSDYPFKLFMLFRPILNKQIIRGYFGMKTLKKDKKNKQQSTKHYTENKRLTNMNPGLDIHLFTTSKTLLVVKKNQLSNILTRL
jgi:hypothetical protein